MNPSEERICGSKNLIWATISLGNQVKECFICGQIFVGGANKRIMFPQQKRDLGWNWFGQPSKGNGLLATTSARIYLPNGVKGIVFYPSS